MNSIYEEIRAAIFSVWHRRWLALAVAWGVCLLGWLVVATVPNSYQSKARIFVQLDDALAEQIGIGLSDRKRNIERVRQTLTSAVNLEKVVRSTRLGDGIDFPKKMELMILGLAKNVKVVSQQDNLFEILPPNCVTARCRKRRTPSLRRTSCRNDRHLPRENMSGGRGEMTETLDFMNQQLADRQKQLEEAEQRRLAFEAQHPEMVQGGASGLQRLETSRSELRGVEPISQRRRAPWRRSTASWPACRRPWPVPPVRWAAPGRRSTRPPPNWRACARAG